MKLALALAGAVVIAGCATNEVSQQLASAPGVQIERDTSGNAFVASYQEKLSLKSDAKAESLSRCVSQVVVNHGVTLTGTATTIGPYTGRMYATPTAQTAAGGTVIKFVSDDKRSVVAEGSETYRGSGMAAMTQRNIRFTLSADVVGNALQVKFDNLNTVQLDTGVAANSGYHKLGAWSSAKPEEAIDAMRAVSRKLRDCL